MSNIKRKHALRSSQLVVASQKFHSVHLSQCPIDNLQGFLLFDLPYDRRRSICARRKDTIKYTGVSNVQVGTAARNTSVEKENEMLKFQNQIH